MRPCEAPRAALCCAAGGHGPQRARALSSGPSTPSACSHAPARSLRTPGPAGCRVDSLGAADGQCDVAVGGVGVNTDKLEQGLVFTWPTYRCARQAARPSRATHRCAPLPVAGSAARPAALLCRLQCAAALPAAAAPPTPICAALPPCHRQGRPHNHGQAHPQEHRPVGIPARVHLVGRAWNCTAAEAARGGTAMMRCRRRQRRRLACRSRCRCRELWVILLATLIAFGFILWAVERWCAALVAGWLGVAGCSWTPDGAGRPHGGALLGR